jgi:hypothetical protein
VEIPIRDLPLYNRDFDTEVGGHYKIAFEIKSEALKGVQVRGSDHG